MDKVTLRREFCQTIALKSVLILTVCAAFAPAEPCSGEELISPTVTTVVKEVRQIADEAGAHYVAYLYDAVNERVLPIWISPDQAFSIATVLNDTPFPRPLTHDLMSTFLRETDTSLEQIVVDTLRPLDGDRAGGTYFAVLTLRTSAGTQLEIDARPSDAMALAVRLGLKVRVSRAIMDHNGFSDKHPVSAPKPARADPYY